MPLGAHPRRTFLQGSLALSGSAFIGCDDEGDPSARSACADPFARAELVSEVPFGNEGTLPLDVPTGAGLDGRLYTDLTKLSRDDLVIDSERFYIRTRYPDLLDATKPWQIAVSGLVGAPKMLTLADLALLEKDMGVRVLECSGNAAAGHFGLLSAAAWSGAPIADLLALVDVKPEATRVLVSGFDEYSTTSTKSTPGASWVFTFEQLADAGAFLALGMNGAPLSSDHGAPVRLFVPGWYGCTCIKWVNQIVLVDDAEPATSQMQEFAARTHQDGVPALAKDYKPAIIEQAAMPVRVEKWRMDGKTRYRVIGLLWGGAKPTDKLQISFGSGPWEPVDVCPKMHTNATWTLFEHAWSPSSTGDYAIRLRVDDPSVPQIRLDLGWYRREVVIDEV